MPIIMNGLKRIYSNRNKKKIQPWMGIKRVNEPVSKRIINVFY